MLDAAILSQLRQVYAGLEADIALVMQPSDHAKQEELRTMLTELASTSDKLSVREEGTPSDAPRFALHKNGEPSGITFTGVPGGHEFTSLVLAVLHIDGKGKQPDEGLIDRVRRLKGPIHLRTFVSLSCENCPDVVQALNLMATHHPDFHHETVDGGVVPELVESLGIRGVPAVHKDTTLVSSGKTTLAELLARLEQTYGSEESVEPRELGHFDVVVIGGGPAGASSAVYSARKGLSTVVITDRMGGQLQDTKGIENLISVPYTEGPKLSANLADHLGHYGIDVLAHRRVTAVEPGTPVKLSLDSGETVTAGSLIVATGAKWRELGVPGEKEYLGRGVAFCPHCDGPLFKGKDIAVVGGGNSGVEAAIDLAGIVKSVTVLEFMPEAKADQVLLDKLASLPNASLITNARTVSVEGDGSVAHGLVYEDRASGEHHTLDVAGVFVQIGLVPNSSFLGDVVDTNRYGEIVIDDKCRTSATNIYAAGDVTTVPYKQIVVAIGEGAKAALAAFEDRMVA
ncbi:MAG: alkyl hydroperoxide reductase subunit F [Deltaproteobacteria bacterium]|nr:MAG: alkyl hydroperoxide reductase subunit F [Deltaproteobacteria bacterium]